VLALELAVDLSPIGLGVAAMALLGADRTSSALSVISAGNGQLSPALARRFNVCRTVDGATPTRRAISLSPTPAVLKRSTSRTWRIVVVSAGIRSPLQKAKGADPNRASRGAAYPVEIIPEWRAKSSWNAERDQIGMVGDIIADSRATSPGIRTSDVARGTVPHARANSKPMLGPMN
jgi:hypothetical protein